MLLECRRGRLGEPFSREIHTRGILILASGTDATCKVVSCDILKGFCGGRAITRGAIIDHGCEGTLGRKEGCMRQRRRAGSFMYLLCQPLPGSKLVFPRLRCLHSCRPRTATYGMAVYLTCSWICNHTTRSLKWAKSALCVFPRQSELYSPRSTQANATQESHILTFFLKVEADQGHSRQGTASDPRGMVQIRFAF